jgi:predicted acylesterase/phospholipase RssA
MAERGSGDIEKILKNFPELTPEAVRAIWQMFRAMSAKAAEQPLEQHDEEKRAICLAGGGPAAGLHIGVLEGLRKHGIRFNNPNSVWALSCIGAWVGVIYNQAKGDKLEKTKEFFRGVFRDDKSFESFPVNTIFSTDWFGNAEAVADFLLEPKNYRNAILPREIMKSFLYTMSAMRRTGAARFRRSGDVWSSEFADFNEGDFNRWTLNHILAVNPMVRFLTAMLYKSQISGLSRLYYPESRFINDIDFAGLNVKQYGGRSEPDEVPYIFYNAWNLTTKQLQLFTNKLPPKTKYPYKPLSPASICACSALPFILQTVTIDGQPYCEGALRDTVNFEQLLEDHDKPAEPLEEIWVNRIVDAQQIRNPQNVHDALANLCEMFAATVGEDDVKLFKCHVREAARKAESEAKGAGGKAEQTRKKGQKATGTTSKAEQGVPGPRPFTGIIVEVKVDSKIDFHWNHHNLEKGIDHGHLMADAAYRLYEHGKNQKVPGKVLMIPDDLSTADIDHVLNQYVSERHREHVRNAVLAGHPRDSRHEARARDYS